MSRTQINQALIPSIIQLCKYRRPTLVYNGATNLSIETGIVTGTSGDATMLFPDGDLRTETSASRYQMTITQNAVFNNATLGSNQGGLRTGSVSNNTWYCLYAVKVSTFSANWVLVADTVTPVQANYSTLNTNFGTNGWVYVGVVPYGDGASVPGAFTVFYQSGNSFVLANNIGDGRGHGVRLATTASAQNLTWSYAIGSSIASAQVPPTILIGTFSVYTGSNGNWVITPSDTNFYYEERESQSGERYANVANAVISRGMKSNNDGTTANTIYLTGYVDNVLGVGSNPLL